MALLFLGLRAAARFSLRCISDDANLHRRPGEAEAPRRSHVPRASGTSRARPRTFEAFVLAVFVLGAALRLPTFGRPLLSDDEAIYAATGDALGRGDLLYRDVVDHKPPLIYHVYQAGFAAFGRYNTQGAHALVIL